MKKNFLLDCLKIILLLATTMIQTAFTAQPTNPSKGVINVTLTCDELGIPTPEALETLLKENFPRCPGAIVVKPICGGMMNCAIFKAYLKKEENPDIPIFFLKISKIKNDWENLKKLQEGSVGRLGDVAYYADTKKRIPYRKLPIIIKIERFFRYTSKNDNDEDITNIIEVTHAASGVSVREIYHGDDSSLQKKCFGALGMALGSFQQAFMDYRKSIDPKFWITVAHEDFHMNNIVFNEKNSRIFFIDNCSMMQDFATTLTRDSITRDFYKCLPLQCLNIKNTHIYSSFFKEYISSFTLNKRKYVKKLICSLFAPDDDDDHSLDTKISKICFLKLANNSLGLTAVHIATITDNVDDLNTLKQANANINAQDNNNCTPLFYAIKYTKTDATKFLLQAQATFNEKELTELFSCSEKFMISIIPFLKNNISVTGTLNIAKGNFDDAENTPGCTLLHYAAHNGYLALTKALLELGGIKINAKNNSNETALALAKKQCRSSSSHYDNSMSIVTLLEEENFGAK